MADVMGSSEPQNHDISPVVSKSMTPSTVSSSRQRPALSLPTGGDDFLSRLQKVEQGSVPSSLVMPLLRGTANAPRATGANPSFRGMESSVSMSSRGGAATAGSSKSAAATPSKLEAVEESDDSDRGKGKAGKKSKKNANAKPGDKSKKDAAPKKDAPRHRRVYKSRVGEKLGLTLIDHPTLPGVVVVAELAAELACARNGVNVGDQIVKINGEKVEDHKQAMRITDLAWATEAEDPSKDRLKFSLLDRTKEVVISDSSRTGQVSVTVLGSSAEESRSSNPLPIVGLTLINNTTAGIGVVVLHVDEGGLAAQAGVEVGHVIQSVNGVLAWDHKEVLSAMLKQIQKEGRARLVVAMRKLTEENVSKQRVGEIPINIVIGD